MSCSFRVIGIEGGSWTKVVLPGGLQWLWPVPTVGSMQLLDHSVSLCPWGKPGTALSEPLKPWEHFTSKALFWLQAGLGWSAPVLPTASLKAALKVPQGRELWAPAAPLAFFHSAWNYSALQRKFPQTEPGLVCRFKAYGGISWPPQRRCPVSMVEVSITSRLSGLGIGVHLVSGVVVTGYQTLKGPLLATAIRPGMQPGAPAQQCIQTGLPLRDSGIPWSRKSSGSPPDPTNMTPKPPGWDPIAPLNVASGEAALYHLGACQKHRLSGLTSD